MMEMGKKVSLKSYVDKLQARCVKSFGEDFVVEYVDLIESAARHKMLLDRFDDEIAQGSLTVVSTGSQGQMKEDINPIIKHRNDVAKIYNDNLEALMLTPRSRYKKRDSESSKEEDKMADYFSALRV